MNTLERIQGVLRVVLDSPELSVRREMSAKDVPQWDSFAHVSIVIALEKEFDVSFAYGELEKLLNIGEMIEIIESRARS